MGGLGCLRRTGRDLRPYKARKGHGYLPGTQGKRCEVWTRMRLGPTGRHPALPPGPRGHAQHPRDQASDVTATLPGPLQSRSPPTLEEDISPGGLPAPRCLCRFRRERHVAGSRGAGPAADGGERLVMSPLLLKFESVGPR